MIGDQPFFAVRISVYHADGSSSTRDYVRGQQRMGKDRFAAFALGDMLTLLRAGEIDISLNRRSDPVTWAVTEVSGEQVRENRRYHHTTHTEG